MGKKKVFISTANTRGKEILKPLKPSAKVTLEAVSPVGRSNIGQGLHIVDAMSSGVHLEPML